MTIEADLSIDLRSTQSSIDGSSVISSRIAASILDQFEEGQGDFKIERQIIKKGSLGLGGILDVDLTNVEHELSEFDPVNFSRVHLVYVRNLEPKSGQLILVGKAPSNPWDDWLGNPANAVEVGPQGIMLRTAPHAFGWPVTPSSKILRLQGAFESQSSSSSSSSESSSSSSSESSSSSSSSSESIPYELVILGNV